MALAYESLVPSAYRSEFVSKVVTISNRLGIDPNWLMIVMRFETAGYFTPNIKNKTSGAVGLIQFTEVAIKGWGVTLNQLAAMTAVQQLDYVEKYLTPYKGRMTDLYNLYLAVFSPAYIGRPDAQKVYASPSNAYTSNKALDANNDGVITVGEIKSVIDRYIPAGYSAGGTILTSSSNSMPLFLIIAAVAILFFLLFKRS